MSVKVGVRVRPFNQREVDLNCKLCVDMIGPTTRLYEGDDPDKFRDFTFDYSFWSHDQFTPDERGYFVADSDKYADQQQVFQKVGLQILQNAWQGYHCCLFAYGQTGAGKSYSMVGYGANKGIVPISCQQIFNRIGKNDDPDKQYEVNVSMLQIYNQKVQDLLIPIAKRPKQGYKIRQHKTLGIYVQGLTKHYVDTYDSIQKKMEQGGRNRSIAATQMNASSSRAHTIISIQFKQRQVVQGKKREKLSVIYLVDLAGSEKVAKTGATGDRLKQAAGINKSLSVLGLVISTLADKAMGKGKNIIVPYRDSCLTRILQNALGGNSKTLMICAISPASDNYDETLSTLRYADQAKKIKNNAVINESQTDKLIRTLKAEKDELAQKVKKMQEMFAKISKGLVNPAQLMEHMNQLNQAKQQLRFNSQMMKDMTMTKTQKLKHQQQQFQSQSAKFDKSKPHLSNLNQDPQLSRRINYAIDKPQIKIGKRGLQPPNDIEIGGMGIRPNHAVIIHHENKFYIEPLDTQGEDSDVYVNGDALSQRVQVFNLDRISIGANHMFLVMIPDTEPREQIDEFKIDWDFAQNQLYLKKETIQKQLYEQKQRKMKQQTEAILKQKQQQLAALQKKLLQNQQARKNIEQQKQIQKMQMQKKIRQQQAQRLKAQIENKKKKIQDSQTQHKQKIKQKYYFQKKLLKTLPKCIQLNLIAKQFKRNISMSVKMMLLDAENQDGQIDMKKRSIKIKVVNRQVGYTYWWNIDKLSNRYYIIKDMSQTYFQTGVIPTLDQKDDPFWDPPEHSLIGRGFLTTKALAYMFDNPVQLPIIGEDDHCGQLSVNLVPTDETGKVNLCEQMDDEVQFQPEELLQKPFYFNLIIQHAKIPANYQNTFVQYSLKVDEINTETFKTQQVIEKTQNPKFNYTKLHKFANVSEEILQYLSTAKLIFKVFGIERIPEQKKQIKKQTKREESDIARAKKQAEKVQTQLQKSTAQKAATQKPAQTTANKTAQKNTTTIPMNISSNTKTAQDPTKKPNQGNTIPKRGKDEKDCVIY